MGRMTSHMKWKTTCLKPPTSWDGNNQHGNSRMFNKQININKQHMNMMKKLATVFFQGKSFSLSPDSFINAKLVHFVNIRINFTKSLNLQISKSCNHKIIKFIMTKLILIIIITITITITITIEFFHLSCLYQQTSWSEFYASSY